MTTPNPSNPPSRRRPGAGWILALALAPFASCGGEASEPEPAAVPAPVTRSATPEGAEAPAGESEPKLERAARQSREALDRLEEAVDQLTPDQRLDFDEAIEQLEQKRAAAMTAVEEAESDASAKPGKLRKLTRELARIATEADTLAEKAEEVAADAT